MNRLKLKTFPSLLPWCFCATVACLSNPAIILHAQSASATPPIFRLDGGNTTYAFGVNERGELQQIYWGGRISATDAIATPHSDREWASFDSSYNNTPQ